MQSPNQQSKLSALGFLIWGLAALFFLYEFFLRTFIGGLSIQIIPALHLNAFTFSLIGSVYYLTYAIMQIPVGLLTDRFGVKLIIVLATLITACATFLFAYADNFMTGLISRLVMGFGCSFAFICLLVIVIAWFPKQHFGFFSGASQFIGTLGPILAGGPLVNLIEASHYNWRTALNGIGLFGVLLAFLMLLFVKNKSQSKNKLILLKPTVPLNTRLLKLLENKQAWSIACYSACIYAAMPLLGAIWGTAYLEIRGLSQTTAANIISISWLGYAIGCVGLGALSDFTKRRKPILIACSIIGVLVTSVLIYYPLSHEDLWLYILLLFSLGIAASGQNVGFAAIAEHVGPSIRATALGLNNGTMLMFGALIPPLASYFIYLSAKTNTGHALIANNFMIGFSILPLMYSASLIITIFMIQETYCKPQKETILLQRVKSLSAN